ncbi:ATPase family gene 2 protein [Grifola frondosa]|uniref:ATPase family gene 2 protein n=1 Tax=Grifola frondosa TaxID=5627 RepID=A0A1C7M8H4_GRIFR|nr:ATPase family gene 2 protein [Grifola frondosa]
MMRRVVTIDCDNRGQLREFLPHFADLCASETSRKKSIQLYLTMTSLSSKMFVLGEYNPSEATSRAARRVIINADIIKLAKICAGDVVALSSVDALNKAFAVGIAWPSHELSQDTVLVSPSLLLTARVSEGVKVRIFPLNIAQTPAGLPSLRRAQDARTVRLKEVSSTRVSKSRLSSAADSDKGKRRDWLTLLIRESLVDLKYVTPTQTLDVLYEGQTRRFTVSSVLATRDAEKDPDITESLQSLSIDASPQLWTVGWNAQIVLETEDSDADKTVSIKPPIQTVDIAAGPDAYSSVGGLEKQIAQIRDLIEIPLTRPDLFRHFGLKPPRGILLHAHAQAPCIVVLDEVDALCPRREDGPGGEVEKRVVAQLLTIMDGMADEGGDTAEGRVVVVATTNRPNAIDPALRRPGRFDREIEIGIPDAEARLSILSVLLSKTPHSISEEDLRAIAARAHGYVGADLSAVIREAGTLAIKRFLSSQPPSPSTSASIPQLILPDLLDALPTVRPSALRALFLDTVPVRYSDIGGQASTIAKLRECVEWPLCHPDAFARLGVRPPKGVLLYGPPGCSKTLLVRACATESGVNFLAVKGPELLNKFVGESEKAVREIFSKARAASPSIIFFDEIDALATSRSASDSSGGAHEGVLTSLLNEMDGVQELVGVTIVAATNRPDVIDSALMRPGRLDRMLYVGPPDQQGREDILRIRTRKMSVEPGLDLEQIAQMTEGCSGAEIAALCQEAALLTMKRNIDAQFVPQDAFITAAHAIKKQITPDVIETYARWRTRSGLTDV